MTAHLRMATAVSIVCLAAASAGCGPEPPAGESRSLAVVVSVHRNAPEISWKSINKDRLPELTIGTRIVAVGIDGSPNGVDISDQTIRPADDELGDQKMIQDARTKLDEKIVEATAARPESDPLGAIAAAADRFEGASGKKDMVIVDSLLSTAGLLRLQELGFDWAVEDVVERVTSIQPSILPELTGFDVTVVGVGKTLPPQPDLDKGRRRQLQDLWRVLLEKAGAKSVKFVDAGLGTTPAGTSLTVTPVPVDRKEQKPPPPPPPCKEQIMSETVVRFESNTANFLEPERAAAAARRVADAMKDCVGTLRVVGTTSSWGTEAGRKLVSTDRARAFRNLLAGAMGVPSQTIYAIGVGMHFKAFVPDRNSRDQLIEKLAILNRTVRVSLIPEGR